MKLLLLTLLVISLYPSALSSFANKTSIRKESLKISQVFSFTGKVQSITVPQNMYYMFVDIQGAAGGDAGRGGSPGFGARVQTYFSVVPGTVYNVYVGGAGSISGEGGWNGGGTAFGSATGGGGASDIRRRSGNKLADRIVTAGGGGGYYYGGLCNNQKGGDGGDVGGLGSSSKYSQAAPCPYCGPVGGSGGTSKGGGVGGYTPCYGHRAVSGAFGQGGAGGTLSDSGCVGAGGGGGGYYGGGGGICQSAGGGGSSFSTGLNTVITPGYKGSSGSVTIDFYSVLPSPTAPTTGSPSLQPSLRPSSQAKYLGYYLDDGDTDYNRFTDQLWPKVTIPLVVILPTLVGLVVGSVFEAPAVIAAGFGIGSIFGIMAGSIGARVDQCDYGNGAVKVTVLDIELLSNPTDTGLFQDGKDEIIVYLRSGLPGSPMCVNHSPQIKMAKYDKYSVGLSLYSYYDSTVRVSLVEEDSGFLGADDISNSFVLSSTSLARFRHAVHHGHVEEGFVTIILTVKGGNLFSELTEKFKPLGLIWENLCLTNLIGSGLIFQGLKMNKYLNKALGWAQAVTQDGVVGGSFHLFLSNKLATINNAILCLAGANGFCGGKKQWNSIPVRIRTIAKEYQEDYILEQVQNEYDYIEFINGQYSEVLSFMFGEDINHGVETIVSQIANSVQTVMKGINFCVSDIFQTTNADYRLHLHITG